MMNLITIVSCGYFGVSEDIVEKNIYYCIDLPKIKTAKDLEPKLSIKCEC